MEEINRAKPEKKENNTLAILSDKELMRALEWAGNEGDNLEELEAYAAEARRRGLVPDLSAYIKES